MIVNLEPLFNNEGYTEAIDYKLDLSELSEATATPAVVRGEVKNSAGVVTLKALCEFTYSAPCDRCGTQVERPMSVPVEHCLIGSLNDSENDDGYYVVVSEMRLELNEVIREDVLLSLPAKFLCSPECKGLCQLCGCDLNVSQCNCKKPIDPRLEGLLQFLE